MIQKPNIVKRALEWIRLPRAAKAQYRQDRVGLQDEAPDIGTFVDEGIKWLMRAQTCSITNDGGVARDFSLISGWNSSYPETTGYIVPTMLAYGKSEGRDDAIASGRRMLDWLVSIQLPCGGFQGGRVDARRIVPVTFNTGQILIGLASGIEFFGEYHEATRRAADFLRDSLDSDGCWRNHPTPFAEPGEKAYETHVSWGLFEAERQLPGSGYAEAAIRQVDWALSKQRSNGWVEDCCLDVPEAPLTHTLGYFLRGVVEAHRFTDEPHFLEAALKTGDALRQQQEADGRLAGRFYDDWRPAVDWVCLTGNVQIAHSWLYLFQVTGERAFLEAGRRANEFVRRTSRLSGDEQTRGAVAGAFPIDGDYGRYQYLNWPIKFAIDSNLLELEIIKQC